MMFPALYLYVLVQCGNTWEGSSSVHRPLRGSVPAEAAQDRQVQGLPHAAGGRGLRHMSAGGTRAVYSSTSEITAQFTVASPPNFMLWPAGGGEASGRARLTPPLRGFLTQVSHTPGTQATSHVLAQCQYLAWCQYQYLIQSLTPRRRSSSARPSRPLPVTWTTWGSA